MKFTTAFLIALLGHEALEAQAFTPATFQKSTTRVSHLFSTMEDPKKVKTEKAKKLAKLEILKIESNSLVTPLKEVSCFRVYCSRSRPVRCIFSLPLPVELHSRYSAFARESSL
jgi:hypothetical protein